MIDIKRARTIDSHKADCALAARAAGGDRQAMTELSERLLDLVRTSVRFISGNIADQDDWTQLALMEILRSIGSFRGESSLETWANRIVIRKTMRLVKKDRRRSSLMQTFVRFVPTETSLPGPDDDRMLIRERLSIAFGKLPVRYRAVMTLRLIYEHGVTEIAETVGIPKNTVRQRLRRGRKLLREKVEKDTALREILNERGR